MLKAHVGLPFCGKLGQGCGQPFPVTGLQQSQNLFIPAVIFRSDNFVLGNIDLVPKERAGEISDANHGHPFFLFARQAGRQASEFLGQRKIVVEIVRGQHQRDFAARIQEIRGDNRSRINRKTVVIDRLGLDPDGAGRADAGFGQPGVNSQCVGQCTVFVPVFINVQAAHPWAGLP